MPNRHRRLTLKGRAWCLCWQIGYKDQGNQRQLNVDKQKGTRGDEGILLNTGMVESGSTTQWYPNLSYFPFCFPRPLFQNLYHLVCSHLGRLEELTKELFKVGITRFEMSFSGCWKIKRQFIATSRNQHFISNQVFLLHFRSALWQNRHVWLCRLSESFWDLCDSAGPWLEWWWPFAGRILRMLRMSVGGLIHMDPLVMVIGELLRFLQCFGSCSLLRPWCWCYAATQVLHLIFFYIWGVHRVGMLLKEFESSACVRGCTYGWFRPVLAEICAQRESLKCCANSFVRNRSLSRWMWGLPCFTMTRQISNLSTAWAYDGNLVWLLMPTSGMLQKWGIPQILQPRVIGQMKNRGPKEWQFFEPNPPQLVRVIIESKELQEVKDTCPSLTQPCINRANECLLIYSNPVRF